MLNNEKKQGVVKQPKADQLDKISTRYVEDHELQDVPARLFRTLLKKSGVGVHEWTRCVRNYLEWAVRSEEGPEKEKIERAHKAGNIKDTFFHKPTLSFNKLLEGVSILGKSEAEVILRVKDSEGNVIEVSESVRIMLTGRKDN